MYRACSRCGKIHPQEYKCNAYKEYNGGEERRLRNTHRWSRKSLDIRQRADYLCEVCRDEGRFTYENIGVHHIEKITDRPDLLLDDENLICLCAEHHHKADAGDIPKDYLKELARKRDGNKSPHSF